MVRLFPERSLRLWGGFSRSAGILYICRLMVVSGTASQKESSFEVTVNVVNDSAIMCALG